jgi:hypothetical protein
MFVGIARADNVRRGCSVPRAMIGRSICFFPQFWNKAPRGADVIVPFLSAEARLAKKNPAALQPDFAWWEMTGRND